MRKTIIWIVNSLMRFVYPQNQDIRSISSIIVHIVTDKMSLPMKLRKPSRRKKVRSQYGLLYLNSFNCHFFIFLKNVISFSRDIFTSKDYCNIFLYVFYEVACLRCNKFNLVLNLPQRNKIHSHEIILCVVL